MSNSSFIMSGPVENLPDSCTLGKYFKECLLKRDRKETIFIDAISGEEQTAGGMLDDAIKTVYVLKDLGVKKDDVIAVISENNIKYYVPVVAACFMGVAANLLNPAYSIGELRHALQYSKPKVIICSSTAFSNVQILKKEFTFIQHVLLMGENDRTLSTSVLHLQTLLDEKERIDSDGFTPESFDTSKQVALLLLSSGTTGLPKTVPITHFSLRCSLAFLGDPRQYGLKENDRVASLLPFFHIFGLVVSISPMCIKTKVIVFQKLQRDVYFKAIEKYRINKLQIVPSILQMFADQKNLDCYNVSSIEDILIGGAPLSNHSVAEVVKRLTHVNFREVYGATEMAGALSIVTKFPKRDNCIGALIPNHSVKVWDPTSETVLDCMKLGELCFKGPMVMTNYFGIPNSKNIIDGDGFYHTGDVGYYDEDGLLYVVDRIKDLIKYKGFQVSPAEIERIILSHVSVEDCGVIGIRNEQAGEVPLAFVVRKADCTVTEQEIIEFVAERISPQKHLHGGVRFIDKIPKTASGKILRRELTQLLPS